MRDVAIIGAGMIPSPNRWSASLTIALAIPFVAIACPGGAAAASPTSRPAPAGPVLEVVFATAEGRPIPAREIRDFHARDMADEAIITDITRRDGLALVRLPGASDAAQPGRSGVPAAILLGGLQERRRRGDEGSQCARNDTGALAPSKRGNPYFITDRVWRPRRR